MTVLIVGEHDNTILTPSSLHMISAAQKLGGDIDLLIAGKGCLQVAQKACKIEGLRKVLLLDKPELGHHGAEAMGEAVVQIGKSYDYIMAPATNFWEKFSSPSCCFIGCCSNFRCYRD
jgi:electron transfer flavoprotein alpha subunit